MNGARSLLPLLPALLIAAPGALATGSGESPHPVVSALQAAGSWKALEPSRTFGSDTVYEEIDGEAELFLPYGMRLLTVAIVGRTGDPSGEIRLELYRMDSPRDAYGIWSQHRHPGQEIVRLPSAEATVSDASADFFRGDTFVRIRAKPSERSRTEVAGLAAAVAALLPGSGTPPEEARVLSGFPGTVPGSVLYQKREIIGYEGLAPGFEAERAPPPGRVRLLLLPHGVGRLPRLARELPGFRELPGPVYRAELPSGPLRLSRAGSCLVGIAGEMAEDDAGRVLAGLAASAAYACGPPGGD